MDGATRTESTTDERVEDRLDDRTQDRAHDPRHDLTGSILSPAEVARPDEVEDSRPLVRHGSDLLDLVAGGVPFAVAHDVRASARPADPTGA